MLRLSPFLANFIMAALIISCKTTRPTVEIQEKPYTPTAVTGGINANSSPVDDAPASTLKISTLILPEGAKDYTRISLTLMLEGSIAQSIENYSLNDPVTLKPYKTYTLILRVYAAGVLIYSNEFCKSSTDFKSKIGPNTYTVPLCALATENEEENVPAPTQTKTDATQTEPESMERKETSAPAPASDGSTP